MNFHLAKNYLKHFFNARNEHSLHSPFVFEFYNECLKNNNQFYSFDIIEKYRKNLISSTQVIKITELGAGSKVNQHPNRAVKDIAKNSLKNSFLAQQLFKIINYLNPKNAIEIGTSLGITTSYLASANKNITVFTLEGCNNTSTIAQQTFENLNLKNINLIKGEFTKTLPLLIKKLDTIDFVFFDGNHQYNSTIDYFNLCKEKANENTCFVFDDIYWSKEMTKAWHQIQKDPQITLSIDTFYFGICFFRTNQPKQHFILK